MDMDKSPLTWKWYEFWKRFQSMQREGAQRRKAIARRKHYAYVNARPACDAWDSQSSYLMDE